MLNCSYSEFIQEIHDTLPDPPYRIKKDDVIPENIQIDWLWLSSAKERGKANNLPPPKSLAREDHFAVLRSTISESINMKGKLLNVTLHLHVRLIIKETNGDGARISYQVEATQRQVILLKLNY